MCHGWKSIGFYKKKIPNIDLEDKFPKFGVKKPDGFSNAEYVAEIERQAVLLIGNYLLKEHESAMQVLKHGGRINRVFDEMKVSYGLHTRPDGPIKKMVLPGYVGSQIPEIKKKVSKKKKLDVVGLSDVSKSAKVVTMLKKRKREKETVSSAKHHKVAPRAPPSVESSPLVKVLEIPDAD